MEKKPIGNYLEHRLNGKEDQEGVFNLLLRIGKASRKGGSVRAHSLGITTMHGCPPHVSGSAPATNPSVISHTHQAALWLP